MSRKAFTPEQQQILRSNPYTIKVTRKNLYLSKDLKELFYKEYMSGTLPKDILQKYGYPADILGRQRIYGIAKMIREQYEQEGGFRDVITPGDAMAAGSPEEKLRRLEHQVNYLTQEVEFLKKISSIRSTRK